MNTSLRLLRPLGGIATEPAPTGDELTFAVVGDCQPPLARMPHSQVTHQIMRELRLLRPSLVLYTGDRIWGYGETRQEMLNAFDRFRALADSTGVPFFAAPGNHEMQSDPASVELLEEAGHALYGSFDAGSYHVVALNTDEVNLEGRVTGEQLEWLEDDLARHRDALGIFVFLHRPLYSSFQGDFNPDDAGALHTLFRAFPVRAVFSGHDHLHHEEAHDEIRSITTGGGGGTLYAQPPRGGFAHYLLVRAAPHETEIDVIEPGHLEVVYTAGNDGLEPVSRARLANTTEQRLLARDLEFRVPRLSPGSLYAVSTDFVDWDGTRVELAAAVRQIEDLGDGSVRLSIETPLPDGSAFYATVLAEEPRGD
jgi:3',5'-cyclic AMP phosphodiesterase CpdA